MAPPSVVAAPARPAPARRTRRREPLRAAPDPHLGAGGPDRLLDLPSVPLDEPAGAPVSVRSLAGRAALSVALLAGVVVVSAAVLVGLVAANLLAWRAGRVHAGLVLGTVAVVLALGRALVAVVRRPPASPLEVEIPEAEEPALWAEVRRLAAVVGTRPPDRIAVVNEVNAYVREDSRLLGLVPGPRTLAVGTPLLDVLTAGQLRAVLAHELGHLAGGDTRLGPLAHRTEAALATVVRSLDGHALSAVFVGYWRLQHRLSSGVRRAQELTADRASVAVAGRQAAADALQVIGATAVAYDGYLGDQVVPALERGRRPEDLHGGFRAYLRARSELVAAIARHQAMAAVDEDPHASHPPTAQRIRRVAALPDPPGLVPDERPAAVLLDGPERWAAAAAEAWAIAVAGAPSPVAPVDEADAAPDEAQPAEAGADAAETGPETGPEPATHEVPAPVEAVDTGSTPGPEDDAPTLPELVTVDGLVLPLPPCPPFEATATGWAARLPGRLGRKVELAVAHDGIVLGGTEAPWDDIVHAVVSLGTSNDQGVDVAYELRLRDGRTAKARTSSFSTRHADDLYAVADHVWQLLRVAVSPRLRAPLAAAVALGQRVELAGLLLDREGVAAGRKPDLVVPWRQIGDPVVDGRRVVIPAGVKVLQTPLASRDAILLMDLLPELRSAKIRGELG